MQIKTGRTEAEQKRVCDSCQVGKMRSRSFPSENENPPTKPLEIVHSDIEGKIVASFEGYIYIINFVDTYSKLTFNYAMKHKSEAFAKLKRYLADVSRVGTIKVLRSDGGKEYLSAEEWLRERQIKWEHTTVHTPQQNADSEVRWRILFGMIRSLLHFANLSVRFWVYAMNYATNILNCTMTKSQVHFCVTPYELFYGRKPNLTPYRIFGCNVLCWNSKKRREKLEDRCFPGRYLGLSAEVKGAIIYIPSTGRVILSRTVQYLEDVPVVLASPRYEGEGTNERLTQTGSHNKNEKDSTSRETRSQLSRLAPLNEKEALPLINERNKTFANVKQTKEIFPLYERSSKTKE
jgi:hypothetical protein